MKHEAQRIEGWSVVGQGRLAGHVYNRPGHRDGGMIVTSPVIEIRIMGEGAWPSTYPVAFTASGNAYRLGRPSDTFGVQAAEAFIYGKLSGSAGEEPEFDARNGPTSYFPDRTVVQAALDTTLQKFERIEVYESSFKPM